MAMIDSDSSDDESQGFSTTNVLLGFASKEPTDDSFSQLGGYPAWLDPNSRPSAKLARCKVCHNTMALMLQLNGDLPERFVGHERRLYIFACKSSPCRRKEGSIRAMRGVRISRAINNSNSKINVLSSREEASQKTPPQNLGNTLFNSNSFATLTNANANPFSTATVSSNPNSFSPSVPSNPFQPSSNLPNLVSTPNRPPSPSLAQTFAQKARLGSPPPHSEPPEPWPEPSSLPTPYPSYYLDAELETLDTPTPNLSSTSKIEIDNLPSSTKDEDEADTFESPSLDKTFRRFADRLAQNPLQILRYEFAGSPLLYSKSDPLGKLLAPHQNPTHHPQTSNAKITTISSSRSSSGIPPCPNCASHRVFELQLTPHAIAELEVDETGMEGMDWGTVMMGACAADCVPRELAMGDVGYLEEWVGVQWEEVGPGKR